ncbi:nucleoporin-like protein, partial [Byssothecium circinans]
MAPLPQLDLDLAKCFTGEQQLVSWDVAYNALCDPKTASKSAPLRNFLSAEENLDMLSRPWRPFPEPSAQEKNKLETKTAPAHITPSPSGHYKLDEIKEDCLWLSQEVKISEHAALRLVVQEWQSRPSVQLLSGLTEEEALSVQDAAGFSNLGASTFMPNSSIIGNPSALGPQTDAHFNSSDQRRLRIIDIYYSTCTSILRISQLLMAWAGARDLRRTTPNAYPNDYRVSEDWLEQIGQAIVVKQNQKEATPSDAAALDKCIRAMKARLHALDTGFPWNVSDSILEAASVRWVNAQTTELVHLLHIALLHADITTKDYLPTPTIEGWFTVISETGFFRDFPTVTAAQQPLIPLIQLLTSLVSVAVLKIHLVLDDLKTGRIFAWPKSVYLLDGGVVERITMCFVTAVQLGPSPATPPALAWALLTWQLSRLAFTLQEDRELLNDNEPGQSVSIPTPHPLEEAILPVARLAESEGSTPFGQLAETCVEHGVLRIITQFLEVGMAGFGTAVDRISRDRFRLLYLQIIRAGLESETLDYTPDLIIAVHTIMIGDRTFQNWVAKDTPRQADPIASFCFADKDILLPRLINEASSRYPYELAPFLKFFSALVRGEKANEDGSLALIHELTDKSTFMHRLPDGFQGFHLVNEEEDSNEVALSVDLPLFIKSDSSGFSSQRRLIGSAAHIKPTEDLQMAVETHGVVVDDSEQPFVTLWHYRHSALTYLVHFLSTYAVGSNRVDISTLAPASLEAAAEIIGFFSDLLHASLQACEGHGVAGTCSPELLKHMGISDGEKQDTVSLILTIFEQELRHLCQEPSNEGSLELLVNCTHFLQALLVIAPNRVWPWLARSKLLEGDGHEGSLASILIGTEMVLGRYEFLIGCIRIFSSLVDDGIERSISRKSTSRALTRFNAATTSTSGTSDKIMSNTLLTFARTLASIYEGSLGWKYNRIEDRLEINIGICEAFTTILRLAYSVDDAPKLSDKLTRLVAPAAEYITELYLTKTENNLPTNPILGSLLSGADIIKSSLLTSSAALWKHQTRSTLELSDVLVRVAMLLGKPWTHLEQQLFKATPLLARLYATSDVWKSPVVLLLETLVRGATRVDDEESQKQDKTTKDAKEPPSLLGHLGPRTAKNFLSVLSQLDEPLRIVDIQKNVWNLLSAVVTCKQQWFALYLLTGTTPRENMRAKSKAAAEGLRNRALLSRALDTLSHMDLDASNRPWPLYTAMLGFVTAAQNNWSWALGDIRERKDFIEQLLAFLKWMAKQPQDPKTDMATETRAHQNKFASLAAEILAMYLHSSRQVGDATPLRNIVPSLAYFEDNALQLPSFNVSLHTNLKDNLKDRFPGVLLDNLKRTTLYPASLGQNFFYDIALADKILGFHNGWTGSAPGQGFRSEVIRANINLSLVESQVQLLESWKLLAIELSQVVTKDERLSKVLVRAVKECMKANASSTLPEALFGQLMVSRADLAYVLLKKLVEAKVTIPEARLLLNPIWDAIRASTPDFDNVFSTAQSHYYRSLLRILYLALHFHLIEDLDASEGAPSADALFRSSFRGGVPQSARTFSEPITNKLLEILSDTVAKGFRSLANQLHAEPDTVTPSDFALLTALLQRIIAIPEMSKFQSQAALLFANNNTVRYATSLFSWSDKLTIQTNSNNGPSVPDPIYGELSLLFILSLSSIQSLAETMAVEGILSQLNTANLMNYYRRPGGMGAFNTPPRLHSIWTKGILPLCLNLLLSIGAPIAGEISSFLNQFPEQLLRSSNALNSRYSNRITLSIASETHSLALLSGILDAFRAQGPRLGIQASEVPALEWDRENVREDIEGWMARRGALRERVVGEVGVEREVVERK